VSLFSPKSDRGYQLLSARKMVIIFPPTATASSSSACNRHRIIGVWTQSCVDNVRELLSSSRTATLMHH